MKRLLTIAIGFVIATLASMAQVEVLCQTTNIKYYESMNASVSNGSKVIFVETPGTLSSLLTEDEKDDVRSLIVTGLINNDDLRVLRYMAGRNEFGYMTVGMLEELDMSGATIVAGGEGYKKDAWWITCGDNEIGSELFYQCASLRKVVLPNDVYIIGERAFEQCDNLETVILPEGLQTISGNAFYGNKKLKNVNIPSTLRNVYRDAFFSCPSLTSIDLSNLENLESIPNGAFSYTGLTSIVIPVCVTTIDNEAFYGSKLTSVTFAEGSKLATIGESAFAYNQELKEITIPVSVLNLNNNAFYSCNQLETLIIPEDSRLVSIGDNVITSTAIKDLYVSRRIMQIGEQDFPETLTSITVDPLNKAFEVYDDIFIDKIEKTVRYVPKNKTIVVLPDYEISLAPNVLHSHHNLKTIVLSQNTKDLVASPFYDCYGLKEIYCLADTPPNANDLNNGIDASKVTVYVPISKFEEYKANDNWNAFNLVEAEFDYALTLSNNNINVYNINRGKQQKLEVTVFTPNGPVLNENIVWTSSDENVAQVSETGVVTYVGEGDAKITVSVTVDGRNLTAQCHVQAIDYEGIDNVYYVEAGNLPNLISEEEKATIKKLILVGELNGTDIRFIREMAGAPDLPHNGSLEILDMSNARIVRGDARYHHGYMERTEDDVISYSMFRSLISLKEIHIPKSTKKIDSYAFNECQNLDTAFELPSSVTTLEYGALFGFDKIYSKSPIPATLSNSSIINEDALVIVPEACLTTYRNAKNWSEFKNNIIPDNVSISAIVTTKAQTDGSGLLAALGEEGLAYTQNLTISGTINGYDIMIMRNRMPILRNIDLSKADIVANPYEYYTDSYTEDNRLGNNAFRELNKLRSVILPENITYLGISAFEGCSNLRSVKTFNHLNTIDDYAFARCYSLNYVDLKDGLLSVGYRAFYACERLENINIPQTVLVIQGDAFDYCTSLESIALPDNVTEISGSTFYNCKSLKNVIMPSKVRRIDSYAFYNCNSLTELRIPPMVESIGDHAFEGCTNIDDVYVYIANAKDISINMNTFSCWNKATLHIPNFSYNTYYWDTQWGQFYTKVEFEDTYDEFYTKNTLHLNSETGIIEGDPNATLYERGGLVVEDENQTLTEVELKSDGTDGGSLIATGDGKITADKVNISINVKGYNWYFFCFPFDIPLDAVQYDGEYVWRQYDGAARSRREGGWQNLAQGTTMLSKGRGYIFQGTTDGELKMTLGALDLSAFDYTTDLETNNSESAQDASWNFVGNPYTSYYEVTEETYSAPITVWTGDHYEAYRPGDDDYSFAPYQAFFVQASDDENSVNFNSDNQASYNENKEKLSQAKRRRSQKKLNPTRLLIDLEITAEGDSVVSDKSRIVFNNTKSLRYETSCDASKFFSDSGKAEIFTLDGDGVCYSINERPYIEGAVTMGLKTNVAGVYQISAPRSDMNNVYIVDNVVGITHDLSVGAYEFSADKGYNPGRFTIKMSNTATSIEEFENKTGISINTNNGISINGAADDVAVSVYSVNGALTGSQTGNGTINVPAGVYIVKVGSVPVKVMVKK